MNILIACDKAYYEKWAINFIRTTRLHNPWVNLHVVTVNYDPPEKIDGINYYVDNIEFPNDQSKIPYYQAIRFIKVAEIFSNKELVMTLDCDTICTRPFSKSEFEELTKSINVQRHQKKDKWMAGLVTFGNNNEFRIDFKDQLLSLPLKNWRYGRDQIILNQISKNYNFEKLRVGEWLSFGKGKGIFLTLKGDQKGKNRFLDIYNNSLKHE